MQSSVVVASWLSFVSATDLVDQSVPSRTLSPARFRSVRRSSPSRRPTTPATRRAPLARSPSSRPSSPGAASPDAPIPVSVQPDLPPGDVRSAKGVPRGLSVMLSWKLPTDGDLENVQITRSPGKGKAAAVGRLQGEGNELPRHAGRCRQGVPLPDRLLRQEGQPRRSASPSSCSSSSGCCSLRATAPR